MAKRPASQYYWGDWHKDLALQSCPLLARGLWHEMNCLMHQGSPYGHLTMPNGKPMSVAQLANLAKISERECKKLLAVLEDAAVFSRDEEGTIYSRRMVRDEAIREARAEGGKDGAEHGAKGGEHGKKGGRPSKDKGELKTPLRDLDKGGLKTGIEPPPSSSSSTSSAPSEDQNPACGELNTSNRQAGSPYQSAIAGWIPNTEIIEQLVRISGVPRQFIDEKLVEFRAYWRDHGAPKTSWDSAFFKDCGREWRLKGHEWTAQPKSAPNAFNTLTDRSWAAGLIETNALEQGDA